MEWQPIETAPKDGTEIFVAWKAYLGSDGWFMQPAKWQNDLWEHTWDGDDIYGQPSHWMPLPPTPTAQE